LEELSSKFPRIDTTYISTSTSLPGPESNQKVHERCKESIANLLTRFKGSNIIIISHASPLICLVRGIMSDPNAPVRTGTCSISKLSCNLNALQEKGATEWMLEMNGSCEHLLSGEQHHWSFG